MNERILELNAQADKYAWEKVGKKYDSAGDLNWQWEDNKMEKFAELIVRECAEVSNQAEKQCQHPGTMIKQHFGVDE